jgi:regulatory protein
MATATLSLTGRALRLLSAREHSRTELERKLARFEEVPGTLAQALDALEAKNYINPQRVAESVVHRRSAKLGVARMRQELQAKGLEQHTIQEALQQARSTELARAHAIWIKKFGQPAQDAAGRAKQMRFLAGRGFGGDTIHRVVGGGCHIDESSDEFS